MEERAAWQKVASHRTMKTLAPLTGMNSLVRTPFLFPGAEGNQCKAVSSAS